MVFRKVNQKKLKERVDGVGKSDRAYYIKRKFEVYKVKEGDNFIRILPPVGDEDDFGLDIWVHSYVGIDRGSYLCMAKMWGKNCPLCRVYKEFQVGGKDEEAGALAPRRRTLYWIIDTSDKAQSKKPMVFDAPYRQVAEEIIRRCVDRKTNEIIDISDVKNGREIMFTLVARGNKRFSEYKAVDVGGVYPISMDLAEEIVPLKEVLVVPKIEELEEVADIVREFGVSSVSSEKEKSINVESSKIKRKLF